MISKLQQCLKQGDVLDQPFGGVDSSLFHSSERVVREGLEFPWQDQSYGNSTAPRRPEVSGVTIELEVL